MSDSSLVLDEALALVDEKRLADVACQLVNVPSPTGEEAELARTIVRILDQFGVPSREQRVEGSQSNALGVLEGKGSPGLSPPGRRLLLYAPIDTVTSNDPAEDLPWIGPEFLPEMKASGRIGDGVVYGLGAHNPKGHAACIVEAARCLKVAEVKLKSDLILGFGAGGMPTNARDNVKGAGGHGIGCEKMLKLLDGEGLTPDTAVIAKSGWAVSWEEVGFHWFEVSVHGLHNYVGSRHLMPYENPILDAARLMARMDDWLRDWPERHRSGLVAPQGVISFVEAGWERMPAFTPALCRFRVDLRLSPRTDPEAAEREFTGMLAGLSEELGIRTSCKRLITILGTSTPRDADIVRVATRAWEALEGRKHEAIKNTSGATDANILRGHGIPTARVGMPKVNLPGVDFQLGMNAVAVADMAKLAKLLIRVALDTCMAMEEKGSNG